MQVAGMHASDWHACKWLEYIGCMHVEEMHAGIQANGTNVGRKMFTCKWQVCIHSMSHPEDTPKLREHPINIEEVNSKSKLKSTLVHFWSREQIVKRSKIICSNVHNALFYACCGNAF
jgi:hypothetical protein